MFAILAEFTVEKTHRQTLIDALTADGVGSLRDEAGTLRFDLYEDLDDPGRIYLFEAYEDDAAFDAHIKGAAYLTASQTLKVLSDTGVLTSRRIARPSALFIPRAKQWQVEGAAEMP